MKKVLSILFAALFLLVLIPSAPVKAETTTDVVYFEDGSYVVTVLQEYSTRSTNQKSASKSQKYHASNGELACTLTVHGTFRYDGTTATCTASTYTHQIHNNSWSFSSGSASKSGNTATAKGTFARKVLGITVDSKTLTVSLSCDKNGNLS